MHGIVTPTCMEVIMTVPALAAPETPTLGIDRLDVYRVALDFAALASRVRVTPASLRDQIERASASIVLNLAEGVGRASRPDQAHFFAIARGSALECAAMLDLLRARGVLGPAAHREGRGLLVRVVQMLSRLIDRQPRTAGSGPAA
jgi:four helix bundle protein